jgi:hypothetical protein
MSETNTFIRNSRMSYHDYWLHQPPTVGQKCDLHVYFNDNALPVKYSQEMGVKVFTEPGKFPHLLQVELVAVHPPLNEDFTSGFTTNTWVSICCDPMQTSFQLKISKWLKEQSAMQEMSSLFHEGRISHFRVENSRSAEQKHETGRQLDYWHYGKPIAEKWAAKCIKSKTLSHSTISNSQCFYHANNTSLSHPKLHSWTAHQ